MQVVEVLRKRFQRLIPRKSNGHAVSDFFFIKNQNAAAVFGSKKEATLQSSFSVPHDFFTDFLHGLAVLAIPRVIQTIANVSDKERNIAGYTVKRNSNDVFSSHLYCSVIGGQIIFFAVENFGFQNGLRSGNQLVNGKKTVVNRCGQGFKVFLEFSHQFLSFGWLNESDGSKKSSQRSNKQTGCLKDGFHGLLLCWLMVIEQLYFLTLRGRPPTNFDMSTR